MKRFYVSLFLFVALLLVAGPAAATTITQGSYTPQVTQNTDVDRAAEAIWPAGPTACQSVGVYNSAGSTVNDIVYIAEIESTVDTTAANSLPYWGLPLYPLPTSGTGKTFFEYTAPAVDSRGAYYPINSRYWYAAAGGIDSNVSMTCKPCRVRDPKNTALCLP